jgi:UTP--glucose-1-phosphate uridylyltransferase
MKAVIPAAGMGTRFLPITKGIPKEMLPVGNKPAIQYVVEEATNSGINDILIITGRGKNAIENYFDSSPELETFLKEKNEIKLLSSIKTIDEYASLYYIRQKNPLGLGHAILLSQNFIGNEPFVVLLGDDIIFSEMNVTLQMIQAYSKYQKMIVAIEHVPVEKVERYGIVNISNKITDNTFEIDGIVEKPNKYSSPSQYAVIGRYLFTPTIFTELEKEKKTNGEIQLTPAIDRLLKNERGIALLIDGKRFDTGYPEGWLNANNYIAENTI